jgi:predicted nucleotidyltransferase
MKKAIQQEIDTIKDIIVRTIPVEQIYLFGSYAYGTPDQDSDLDFYVVMRDDAPYREVEAMNKIGLAIYDHKTMSADILLAKKSRFEDRLSASTIEHTIAEKGILLYG